MSRCHIEPLTGHKESGTLNFGIGFRLTSQCQGHVSLSSGSNGQLRLTPYLLRN